MLPKKKPKVVGGVEHWECARCGDWLPAEAFSPHKKSANGLTCWCKECMRAYQRAYRQRPEVKEKERAYRQRPEVKEKERAYRQRPEVKERQRAYSRARRQRPEVKEKKRAYDRARYQRPEVKEKKRARRQRPEVKEKRRAYKRARRVKQRRHRLLGKIKRAQLVLKSIFEEERNGEG